MDKTILIVDDKPEIAKVIMYQLSKDYNVHSVNNPIQAFNWMHEGNIPDLIISDVYMPEMDGHTFLKKLKSSEMFSFIPVIILSSMESTNDRIGLLEDGASDFVLKPFNPQELKIRVRNLLR
ncbi:MULTISPECIES: response regulator [Porphyromonadaceae]|uniref:Chemotaxis protein CheY n=1 Tax=Sanguibacteroides justesenii TaxID=1547597 RepID=A0A0C3MJ84_9PORP|nr:MULTISPECIES: response regulator transcription factor [Porphyromonadaceae]KIO46728.1 chemotaxis protein CheY [Sanguibacteroides justesenii]KIO46883.1 chemotaxis protein CheY [Sanguibacteroides justesenii]MCR9013021.1 response regulator transcription factor [Gabonibacter chumensis]PXZ43506.1 response regulator [Sanguibacteroides justesenii]